MRAWVSGAFVLATVGACGPQAAPCPTAPSPSAHSKPPAAEIVTLHDAQELEALEANPALKQRLMGEAHAYFRFVNRGFAEEVCHRFADALTVFPVVNLHGDPHLEQYAVTDNGRGLADFDDATLGPAIIDLVRLGVSVELTARLYEYDPKPALEALLAGYRAGLKGQEATEPKLVPKLRAELPSEAQFLANIERRMTAPNDKDNQVFQSGYARYVSLIREQQPSLGPEFFAVVRLGQVQGGVGSSLHTRFLVRIAGPTRDPADDVILEAKELRDAGRVRCVQSLGGAFRVVVAQARIGIGPNRLLAVVPRQPGEPYDTPPLWVQEWRHDYRELDIRTDFKSSEDLVEVTRDIATTLGLGHLAYVGAPLDVQLKRAQLALIDELSPRLWDTFEYMTERTLSSWRQLGKPDVGKSRPRGGSD